MPLIFLRQVGQFRSSLLGFSTLELAIGAIVGAYMGRQDETAAALDRIRRLLAAADVAGGAGSVERGRECASELWREAEKAARGD